ncbi:MAG: hypothetical protein LVQ97_02820 [Candidatus Micrarchaeales archaeon]|jgi:hypothetical protein|uniref:DUF4145 domain-containing protein n=1 Tax=Candidatus Micrarchaeum acidiphilum ARMAN-2 TaxID=425595 RepID=C7DG24_MICA2|nr:MAG: hypothetical protein UNLARM2_1008 [Candidatus Micrarchaeum acidiphilum ARMAN-2]MCW6161092.1 hypothetical protein [Candidatus Micrarchaeales archaeon]
MDKYMSLKKELRLLNYLSKRSKYRDKIAKMLLDSSIKKYYTELYNNKPIFFLSFSAVVSLYLQAIECYKYGLFEAATIMCRDAIDAALLSTKLFKNNTVTKEELKNVEKLLKLDYIEIALLDGIKESGNFSAHLYERQQRQAIRMYKEFKDTHTFEDLYALNNKNFGKAIIKFRTLEREVLANLFFTDTLLGTIYKYNKKDNSI